VEFRHLELTIAPLGRSVDDFSDIAISGATGVLPWSEDVGGRKLRYVSYEPSNLGYLRMQYPDEGDAPPLAYAAIVPVGNATLLATIKGSAHWKTEMRWLLRYVASSAGDTPLR
jgi:hypothetical protein